MASESVDYQTLLDALKAADPLAVAAAVRQCTDRLRSADWGVDGLDTLTERIVALAGHESPRVRQAVAEATPYLPEAVFTSLVAKLGGDKSPYVRDATERAQRRRSARKRGAAKDEEHDQRVDGWYAQLDKHRGARRTAQRIAALETEYFVRRLHHEAGGLYVPFADALAKLAAAVEEPQIDRAVVRAQVAQLTQLFGLFRHILDNGRRHARPVDADFREERLRALVEDQARVVRTAFPDRAERIDVDTRELDARLAIDVDASFLKQAIGNILKNAVEAYDAKRARAIVVRVAARLVSAGTQVEIVFADRGCGMGDDDVKRAFVPFGSTKPGGTGFGLYLARKCAREIHGGNLTLASVPGSGTTVTMTLPVRQEKKR